MFWYLLTYLLQNVCVRATTHVYNSVPCVCNSLACQKWQLLLATARGEYHPGTGLSQHNQELCLHAILSCLQIIQTSNLLITDKLEISSCWRWYQQLTPCNNEWNICAHAMLYSVGKFRSWHAHLLCQSGCFTPLILLTTPCEWVQDFTITTLHPVPRHTLSAHSHNSLISSLLWLQAISSAWQACWSPTRKITQNGLHWKHTTWCNVTL